MTPSFPPQLARQRPLPDPHDVEKLPPFSLPIAHLAVGSGDTSPTPAITTQHFTTSQPRIDEIAQPDPDNNRTPLDTTPKISQLLHTDYPAILRPGTLPDPDQVATMPHLLLPVSLATVRHHFASTTHAVVDLSERPDDTTPPPEE